MSKNIISLSDCFGVEGGCGPGQVFELTVLDRQYPAMISPHSGQLVVEVTPGHWESVEAIVADAQGRRDAAFDLAHNFNVMLLSVQSPAFRAGNLAQRLLKNCKFEVETTDEEVDVKARGCFTVDIGRDFYLFLQKFAAVKAVLTHDNTSKITPESNGFFGDTMMSFDNCKELYFALMNKELLLAPCDTVRCYFSIIKSSDNSGKDYFNIRISRIRKSD